MRYTRLVFKLFVLLIFFSVTNCEISKDEKVVLVSPVLAPYRNARAQTNETAKDFPLLMLLASDNKETESNRENKMDNSVPQPVYVKKLEDQTQLLRRRRKTSRIYFVRKY
ncbi:hypothetical protein PYW08_007203 [Mythimna loreyi]|uniref:Uncharacterized protein n=1 Tax=Mythimna loreyi TaxID=667449 RepID=A0ACC2RBS4_9NEOP|nr:hypothetical protein PYW08_007203 [Mythimna loreyi]